MNTGEKEAIAKKVIALLDAEKIDGNTIVAAEQSKILSTAYSMVRKKIKPSTP